MKKLIFKLLTYITLVGLISVLGLAAFFSIVVPQYSYNYNASMVDKVNKLKSIEGEKIILLGNSNVAFGFDSELMEKELGMPVVNMGLHGGLGNAFHEKMVQYNLNAGDIVIVAHNYYSDDGKLGDYALAWITLENHFELYKCLDTKDIWGMLCYLPDYIRNSCELYFSNEGNQHSEGVYDRSAFNEYGDIAVERPELIYTFGPGKIKPPGISAECAERLNRLNAACGKIGATLLVSAYPIANGEFTAPAEDFKEFQRQLDEALDCEIISDFTDYLIDYQYFYDTMLHLNDEGVEIRTRQLITDISEWKNKKP